tara:strand:+ start:3656 stop:3937 length:282 start_codon:yes stop_codon:yes gene_type:complete
MKLQQIIANPDGDLPFATSVNEAMVLECCRFMSPEDLRMNSETIKQWMKFNKGLNEHECDEYQLWVAQVYSHITQLIESTESNMPKQKYEAEK